MSTAPLPVQPAMAEALNLVQKSYTIDWQSHGKLRVLTNRTSLSESIACNVRGLVCREYGPYGNWNPAPLVHPNGSVFLLAHTEQYGFKHGEAIIMADTWRGPYRLVSSDSDARWKGSTANAEDPFMYGLIICSGLALITWLI